jgi:hypothetical protein
MMREFQGPLDQELDIEIRRTAQELFELFPVKKSFYGRDYAMDDVDMLVVEAAEYKGEAGRFRLAYSVPASRPPFEWEYEITSEFNELDYFKHYLVQADGIVLAQRKILLPIDNTEGELILRDMELARVFLLESLA